MKTYHIIDKRERNTASELIHYTFDEVKKYFGVGEEVKDLYDLEELLKQQADGMAQPYEIVEDEVESLEAMEKANRFYRNSI